MSITTSERGIQTRKKMLDAIINYIEQHGYPPTQREIGDVVGLKSSRSIYRHIQIMREQGLLETDAMECQNRAIRVPGYKFVKVENKGESI